MNHHKTLHNVVVYDEEEDGRFGDLILLFSGLLEQKHTTTNQRSDFEEGTSLAITCSKLPPHAQNGVEYLILLIRDKWSDATINKDKLAKNKVWFVVKKTAKMCSICW